MYVQPSREVQGKLDRLKKLLVSAEKAFASTFLLSSQAWVSDSTDMFHLGLFRAAGRKWRLLAVANKPGDEIEDADWRDMSNLSLAAKKHLVKLLGPLEEEIAEVNATIDRSLDEMCDDIQAWLSKRKSL